MKIHHRIIISLVLIMMLLSFTACSDPNLAVEEYAMIVTEEDISQLEMFPNLKYVDLRGSTCYEAIRQYMQTHPDVTVRYNVQFGTQKADSTATEIELNSSDIDYNEFTDKLQYLPNAQKIILKETVFSNEQMESLKSHFPHITFEYTVRLFNMEYSSDATNVDLSKITSEDLEQTVSKLMMLPNVTTAELMSPIGTSALSVEHVKTLQNALPNIAFHYSFELFGKIVSTTDEKIEYTDDAIGNEAEAEICAALEILKGCTYFKLDDCGVDTDVMTRIAQQYPDKKIVWRLHFGKYSVLTDETTIRMPSGVTNENVSDLKYCTDVENLDLSFNKVLSNFEFLQSMPKLKILILNNTLLKDLSILNHCPQIEWLELVFCSKVTDLTPLQNLSNLKYLNVSYTGVKTLAGLENLPLIQFMCVKNVVPEAEENAFISAHPNCSARFTGSYPQGVGWRLKSGGEEYVDYYAKMVELFRYDEKGYTGNRKFS